MPSNKKIEIGLYELDEILKRAIRNKSKKIYGIADYPNFSGASLPSMEGTKLKDFAWFVAQDVLFQLEKNYGKTT